MARDLVAAVAYFGDGLGRARHQLEVGFWDADVGAVGRAADFAAVEAVAETLSLKGGVSRSRWFEVGGEGEQVGWVRWRRVRWRRVRY